MLLYQVSYKILLSVYPGNYFQVKRRRCKTDRFSRSTCIPGILLYLLCTYVLESGVKVARNFGVCLRILRANKNNVSISFEYRISGANCARKFKHRPYLYQYKNDLYISGLVFCTWYSAVFVSTSCFVICGCVALSIVVLRRQRGCRRGCARARGQLAESASRAGLRAPGGTRGAPSYLAQGSGSSSRAAAATAAEASN